MSITHDLDSDALISRLVGVADHGERAGREQAAQVAIASLADIAEPVLAAARVLFGDESDSGREIPS